jgi:hypothetical protein
LKQFWLSDVVWGFFSPLHDRVLSIRFPDRETRNISFDFKVLPFLNACWSKHLSKVMISWLFWRILIPHLHLFLPCSKSFSFIFLFIPWILWIFELFQNINFKRLFHLQIIINITQWIYFGVIWATHTGEIGIWETIFTKWSLEIEM